MVDHGRWTSAHTVDMEECILRYVEENHHTTICRVQAAEHVVCITVVGSLGTVPISIPFAMGTSSKSA
jgi:hypothetical protein